MHGYLITGTDTGIGKTVFAAGLAGHLRARYWKPVQSGLADASDSEVVAGLTAGRAKIQPEAYRLSNPLSPHESARLDGVTIDPAQLALPEGDGPLVVEGAGGVLVPLSNSLLSADLFAQWGLPAIVVARTTLGTINHSLLTLEALKARGVAIAGIAFSGEANHASEEAIIRFGQVPHLGRLPRLDPLDAASLSRAFEENIRTDMLP